MKITVIGAGAVGGYFGGRMAEAGLDVTFLVREKRAEQLRRTGLRLRSDYGDAHLHNVQLATEPEHIEACDLVIVAVKNYHLSAMIESLRSLAAKGAKVLPLLNGMEHYGTLKQALGDDAVLGGMCQVFATLGADGEVVQKGALHNLVVGALQPEQERIGRLLSEICGEAKMRVSYRDNILTQLWSKYAYITAFSGVTTASRLPIGEVLSCEPAKTVYYNALCEMAELAAAKQVPLSGGFADDMVEMMLKMPRETTSSMHADLKKGLPLEVDSLQGGALRLAEEAGVHMPTVSTLYGLIKPFEHGKQQ